MDFRHLTFSPLNTSRGAVYRMKHERTSGVRLVGGLGRFARIRAPSWLLEEQQRFLLLLSVDSSCSTSVTRYAETDWRAEIYRRGIGTSCRDYFAFFRWPLST